MSKEPERDLIADLRQISDTFKGAAPPILQWAITIDRAIAEIERLRDVDDDFAHAQYLLSMCGEMDDEHAYPSTTDDDSMP